MHALPCRPGGFCRQPTPTNQLTGQSAPQDTDTANRFMARPRRDSSGPLVTNAAGRPPRLFAALVTKLVTDFRSPRVDLDLPPMDVVSRARGRGSRRWGPGFMMRVLALLMLPVIAMGLLAAHDTAQYRSDATVASGIRRQVPIVDAMIRLSEELHNEELSAGIALRASEVGLSPTSISRLLGYNQAVNTASLRAATDSAIAALGRASPVSATQIDALRRQVDSKATDPSAATQGFVALDGEVGARLGTLLSSLGNTAEQAGGGDRLSIALADLQASTDALRYGAAQSTDFIDVVLSPANQASAALIRLGADTARYDDAASVLATASDDNVSGTWRRMKARPDVRLFDQTLTTIQEGRGVPPGLMRSPQCSKGQ